MATALSFTEVNGISTCEYTGESGVVQLKLGDMGGWVRVFGDAGNGYMFVDGPEADGNNVIFYLRMTGFDSVKIECKGEVISGTIKEC